MDGRLDITKPWREIVDPAGITISQIKRYAQINKLNKATKNDS